MIIVLLYAAIVLAAITVIGNLMLHKWNAERNEQRIAERVDSYLTSLEQQGVPPELGEMAPPERRDVLLSAGREARTESDKRFYVGVIGGILAFFTAMGFAIEGAGMRDFVITLAVAALAIYGINTYLHRRFRGRLAARGIDLDRIRTN